MKNIFLRFKKKRIIINDVSLQFYNSKKITHQEEDSFIKNYIKSLLLAIEKLHKKGYMHGDIKPNNFLYENSKRYWLIDFDSAHNVITSLRNSSTFPFIPPEENPYTGQKFKNRYNFKSDLWNVGMILFFFIAKKVLFNKYDILNNYSQRINLLLISLHCMGLRN